MQDDDSDKVTVTLRNPVKTEEGIEIYPSGSGARSFKIWYQASFDGKIHQTPLCETLEDCVSYLQENNELVGFIRRQDKRIWAGDVGAINAQSRLDYLVAALVSISKPDAEEDVAARMAKIHAAMSNILDKSDASHHLSPTRNNKGQQQAIREAIRALDEKPDASAELKPVRTRASYCVEVSEEDFLNVSRYEDEHLIEPGFQSILDRLAKIGGVSCIEYNGHFGAAFYFTLEDEDALRMPEAIEAIRVGIDAANNFARDIADASPTL